MYRSNALKLLGAISMSLTLASCASYGGSQYHKDILNCTERLSAKTESHVIDSGNLCLKVYESEKPARTEL